MAKESDKLRLGMDRLLTRAEAARRMISCSNPSTTLFCVPEDGENQDETPEIAIPLCDSSFQQPDDRSEARDVQRNKKAIRIHQNQMLADDNVRSCGITPRQFTSDGSRCGDTLPPLNGLPASQGSTSGLAIDDQAQAAAPERGQASADTLAAASTGASSSSAQQAAELRALAEETARLRHSLDSLLALSGAAHHPAGRTGRGHVAWADAEEQRLTSSACPARGARAAGAEAGEAGGGPLWLQERLLAAVEALLGELRAGGRRPRSGTHARVAA